MVQAMLFDQAEEQICERIHKVVEDLDGTSDEYKVLIALRRRGAFGRAVPLSIEMIQSDYPEIAQRSVRAAVKNLLEVHDLPIGSSRIPGQNGYFFCIADADADFATRHLKNEIYSIFDRIKRLSPKSKFVRELQGQIQLMMEEEKAAADDKG